MEEWIDVHNRKYFRTCDKCHQEIVIEQSGDELPEEVLESIMNTAHVENTYDALLQNIKIGNKWVKIDVEISQQPCLDYTSRDEKVKWFMN